MNAAPVRRQRGGRHRAVETGADAGNILCYMDQGSFVALRALRRQPIGHITWLYPHRLEEAAVTGFNECLAAGLLGRLLQRSPLPWGRHRWVANPVPAPVTWFRDPIPLDHLPAWRSSLINLPIDPEHGPGWRLAVQPLGDGGSALSLLVSHTVADGQAGILAVADAIAGRPFPNGFPAASRRWSPTMLARDGMESLRSFPDAWRALLALLGRQRQQAPAPIQAAPAPRAGSGTTQGPAVELPLVQIVLDPAACEARAAQAGIKSGILLMAFAARLAFRMGRVDANGRVKLVLPVSDRQPGDRRGNALRSVTVMADPDIALQDPRKLQRELRNAQAALLRHGDELSPLLPLIPYVPLWMVRRMERMALGTDLPVGCSLFGELPPELDGPFGKASLVCLSVLERFDAATLDALGGQMFLEEYSVGGRMLATVSGYMPGRITSRADLLPIVREALSEFGMIGTAS